MIVSFVVVAYNAEKNIGKLFDNLRWQTYPHDKIEVILVDGVSSDGTKLLMKEFALTADFLRGVLLDNPKRSLPCGWNVALKEVQGEAVLRLDAHATILDDFIEKNVQNLLNGESISCGRVESILDDADQWKETVNLAENSMFGGSIATFRRAEKAGYVSTGAFAMYKKSIFDVVGNYNELLARTEDNEMHYRMRQAGYRFYFDPQIVSFRQTRPTIRKLVKQKYLNGYWVGLTLGIEPRCFSFYHFVPFAFVMAVFATAVFAYFGVWQLSVLMWAVYVAIAICMAVLSSVRSKKFTVYHLILPFMFLFLHLGYGLGTLIGIMKLPFWKKREKF